MERRTQAAAYASKIFDPQEPRSYR
jgi:hypothetical protein